MHARNPPAPRPSIRETRDVNRKRGNTKSSRRAARVPVVQVCQAHAQQLILSMFPASYQTAGYIPAGTQVSDPANNPQLLSETENHSWFQFNTGSGWQTWNSNAPGVMACSFAA